VEEDVPRKLVLNKADRLTAEQISAFRAEYPDALVISSKEADGVATARQAIMDVFAAHLPEAELLVPYASQGIIGEIRSRTTVLSEEFENDGVRYRVRAHPGVLSRLESLLSR